MDDHRIGRAEDYTAAFLWTAYPLLVVALALVWGVAGFTLALCTSWGLDRGLARWGKARARAEAEWEARVAAALARARR